MSGGPGGSVRFWLVVGAILLVLALLPQSAQFKEIVGDATRWAEETMKANPVRGMVVFFLFSAVSAMVAFASSVVLVPAANLVWGKPVTFLLLWGGWVAGALTAFWIGRAAGPLLVRLGYQEKLERYQDYVSGRMKFWLVLLFCMAVPSEIPGYLFGGMRYSLVKFTVAMGVAEAMYALGVVVAGEKLLAAEAGPFLLVMGAMAVIAFTAGVVLRVEKEHGAARGG